MESRVSLGDVSSRFLSRTVEYSVLTPSVGKPLPLCVFLLGAGGTRESMFDLNPRFDAWWASERIPPMAIAIPSGDLEYYIEDAATGLRWDSFLADEFVPHLRSSFSLSDVCVIAGISGGGYGALKLAFARPDVFSAVAVMQPMVEPGLRASDVGARNRLHHAAGGPKQLIGPDRDGLVWEANNPANRAQSNGGRIRESGLEIFIDAAGRDFLNAHDGAEFLHRVLWNLDIAHEYRLIRDADHGGPTMASRMEAMFEWIGRLWNPLPIDAALESAAESWLASGMKGKAPAGATTTEAFVRFMRAGFEPLRAKAAELDETVERGYGRL